MNRRQISDGMRQWLTGEFDAWRAAGVVAEDQPARILDLYETSTEAVARRQSVAVFALSAVAALMVGVAALLAVAYNWSALSAAAKLAVIFGVLAGCYVAGFWLRYTAGRRLTSEIVLFLACLFYGWAIWLIAQIFNIQSHYPDAFWYWAIGVLPVALCLDTLLMHVLYAGLLALWAGTEILDFPGVDWWVLLGLPVAHAAWTLPLLVVPGLLWAYRRRSALTVAIYAPLLAWWAVLQPEAWHWEVNPFCVVGLAGVLLLLIAEMHRPRSPMARPYRLYGILLSGGGLVPLSYADILVCWLHSDPAKNCYIAGLVTGLVGAAAMLCVVLAQWRRARKDQSSVAASPLGRQWLPLLLILLLAGLYCWAGFFSQYDPRAAGHGYYGDAAYQLEKWQPQVLAAFAAVNLSMIAMALWLMRLGLREDRAWPFAAGVLYFLLWTLLRYIDLFAGVGGMLGAALMFLCCGVGLFAVARYWIRRKEADHV
jgi:hypothetical protein